MSLKHGTNRFFPRSDGGGGGGGADLWTLYGGTVVGLTTLTDTVSIGTNAMLADEKLLVAGGIAATPTIAGNDAFVQVGSGDSTVLSGANSFRLIYNAGTAQAEISTNGGVFVPLASGGASPWTAAAGVITEVVPANLVVVGSAAALTADQFQVLGNSVLRAAVNSTATFAVQNSSPFTIFQVDTVNNASVVRGSYQMSSGITAEVYLESGPSTAANAPVGAGRLRYHNVGTPAWEVSVNGGGYSNLITAVTLPLTAFVQNGNSFGADAVLGTNDAFALQFETSGTTRGRFTSAGLLLVNTSAAVSTEQVAVAGGIASNPTGAGNDAFLAFGSGSGVAVSTANAGRFRYNAGVAQVSLNTGAYSDLITAATLPTVGFVQNGNSFGADAVLGTNDAFALQFETSGTTRGRFTSTGSFIIDNASASVTTLPASTVVTDVATGSTATMQIAGGTSQVRVDDVSGQNVILRPGSIEVFNSVQLLTIQPANITASSNITISAPGGLAQVDGIFAVIQSTLGPVVISGGSGIEFTTASGITVNGASGAAGEVFTSQGAGLPPIWAAAGSGSAFVQNGNSFGADAVLGTNDAFALQFETSGTTKARITTGGALLVGTAAATASELLNVAGSAYVSNARLTGATGYLESVSSTAAVSNVAEGRLRYSNTALAWQVSVNGGAYADLLTSSALASAFVQNGNTFGANALLGTNDNFALIFETNGTARGRFLSTGEFVINGVSAGNEAILTANRTYSSGTGTTKYATYFNTIVNTLSDTGAVYGQKTEVSITGAINAATLAGYWVEVGHKSTGTISQMYGMRVFSRGAEVAALGTVSNNFAVSISHGYYSFVTSGLFSNSYGIQITLDNVSATRTIGTAYGIQVANHGGTGVTNAYGIDIATQSGAATTNIGLRVQGNAVVGGTVMSGSEALRVTGNGFRSDGTSHVVAVSSALSINNSGGAINIGDAANAQPINIGTGVAARTISIGTAAAAFTINIGSTNTTSSIVNSFGTNGFGLIQGAASAGTPIGVLMSAGAHTGLASAEVSDVNFNLARTVTFGAGGGTIATQRAFRVQAPTYAAAAAITLTDAATFSIGAAPTAGANVTMTRRMALWVQSGVARFDGGVGVKVTPGGTTVQGLAADFRKTNDPGSVSYPAGVSTVSGGAYTPATGYLSIIPAFWTLPAAINSGGGIGPPLNPGIRFNWSDGTTTIRYNTSTASSLTETRDTVDFNKDGLAIVGIDFVVDNTSGGAATVDFTAWTLDGNQF